MKENVLDVLMYLFDNYMDDEEAPQPDRDQLARELEQAGFRDGEIEKAFGWLEGLAEYQQEGAQALPDPVYSARVFAPEERERLDVECRGLILYLEQTGILSASHREIVLDRLMALDSDEIDLDQVKWVTLMVLFNMPGQEAELACMEGLVYGGNVGMFH